MALRKLLVDALPPAGKDPMRNLLVRITMMEFESVGAMATLAGVPTGIQGRPATLRHPLALVFKLYCRVSVRHG
jgi:hypothetical protein